MKLITLNIWGGKINQPFLDFIDQHRDIDIFCFQELYHEAGRVMKDLYPENDFNVVSKIDNLLSEHKYYFRASIEDVYGIGVYLKKGIEVLEEGAIMIHPSRSNDGEIDGHHERNLQWVNIKHKGGVVTIINVHGLWNGKGKTDTQDRIDQSNRIKDFMKSLNNPIILCGDFNLLPDTKSLKIVSGGLVDHVKINNISSTRTSYYKKEVKYADYIFTSPEIKVKEFNVLPHEVSDHSPLYIEFE